MSGVFVLQHVHTRGDGEEDVKLIGVYSSLAKARAAQKRLGQMPGFIDGKDGFHIDEYRIDQDHWIEGFVTAASSRAASAGNRNGGRV